jgi:hypothetical protein
MSIEGFEIDVNDGVATVDEQYIGLLVSHGFTTQDAPVIGTRSGNIQFVTAAARSVIENLDDATLGAFVALSDDDRASFWSQFQSVIQRAQTPAVPATAAPATAAPATAAPATAAPATAAPATAAPATAAPATAAPATK